MRSLLVVVALGCWLDSRPAEACSCYDETRLLHPSDGATGLPLNAALVLTMTDDAEPVVLEHESSGERITLDVERLTNLFSGSTVLATSPVELQPEARYHVIVNGVGFGHFITGVQRDDIPPIAAGLTGITPEVIAWPAGCGAACLSRSPDGDITRFRFDYVRPDDVVVALVELDGKQLALSELVEAHRCGAQLAHIDPERTYCARAIHYDAAGNKTVGDEVCGAPTRCEPEMETTCSPTQRCKPASGGCSTSAGGGWLVIALFAFSRGWSRRSARRRPLRARPSSP